MHIFNGGKELCLTTVSTAKSMLIVRQEFVLVIVRHDLGINDMLKNFAGYTFEYTIGGGVMLVSFLEDSNHISRQPVIRDAASANGLLEYVS